MFSQRLLQTRFCWGVEGRLGLSWMSLDRTPNSSTQHTCKLRSDFSLGCFPAWCLRQCTQSLTWIQRKCLAGFRNGLGWHTTGWKARNSTSCSFGLQAASSMTTFILSLNWLAVWTSWERANRWVDSPWAVSVKSNRRLLTINTGSVTYIHTADCHAAVKNNILTTCPRNTTK